MIIEPASKEMNSLPRILKEDKVADLNHINQI